VALVKTMLEVPYRSKRYQEEERLAKRISTITVLPQYRVNLLGYALMRAREHLRLRARGADEVGSVMATEGDSRAAIVPCKRRKVAYRYDPTRAKEAHCMGSFKDFNVDSELKPMFIDCIIRILSVEWLLRQPPGYILQTRQELEELERSGQPVYLDGEKEVLHMLAHPGQLAALSYPWLEKEHSDRCGVHMRRVREFLERNRDIRGLFWDFASLPQSTGIPFGDFELKLRTAGIHAMQYLYGSPSITIIQCTYDIPESEWPHHVRNYWKRGWTLFEGTVASLTNGKTCDLGVINEITRPPIPPDIMREKLTNPDETVFTNDADVQNVATQYETFYRKAAPCQEHANYDRHSWEKQWTKDQQRCFVKALPDFSRLRSISLRGRKFHPDFEDMLRHNLARLPELETKPDVRALIGH